MEPATSILELTKNVEKKFVKEYEIAYNNDLYVAKIGKTTIEAQIYFLVFPKNNSLLVFEGAYLLKELSNLNKSFLVFDSCDDLINIFDELFKNKKIFIEKLENENFSLKLAILMHNVLGKEDKIVLDLKLNKIDNKDFNKNLLHKIMELENKLLQKDEEIKILNNKYKEVLNKCNCLENKYNELENKINIYKEKVELIKSNNLISPLNSEFLKASEINFILQRLNPNYNKIKLDLIFRIEKNNDSTKTFHEKCDGKKNVLVFIETNKNVKFGGFTTTGFNSNSKSTKDNEAFLFSIDKQKIYNVKKNKSAIFCLYGYGPCFCGNDDFNIYIEGNNILTLKCHTSKAYNNTFNIDYNYELNNSEYEFYIMHLEIFQVSIY